MFEKTLPNNILGDRFAKTINCHGIHNNFYLDIPEIIEEEKRIQERKDDIARFTKLAISDMENDSHNKMVEELFCMPEFMMEYEDEILNSLSNNSQLLQDIGLL